MIALVKSGFARRSPSAGVREGLETLPSVSMIALAKPGFARRSPSAGRFGNPPRVSMIMIALVKRALAGSDPSL
jgi:hypothetical protein